MRLGEAIKRRREQAGKSLRELGEASGYSFSYLSSIENGKRSPSLTALEAIAQALGTTPATLMLEGHED